MILPDPRQISTKIFRARARVRARARFCYLQIYLMGVLPGSPAISLTYFGTA
jgi:hypothetical protein